MLIETIILILVSFVFYYQFGFIQTSLNITIKLDFIYNY